MSYEELERAARELADQGASDEELVLRLHELGATIIDSIKVIRRIRRIPLGVAKEIISCHPVWHEVVTAAETLHDEAVQAAEQAARESGHDTRR